MPKQWISVTLERDNLTWLRGRARATGRSSVSEMLNQLVTEARNGGRRGGASETTVVGTIRISAEDPDLAGADKAFRDLFAVAPGKSAGVSRRRPRCPSRDARDG